MTDVTDPIARPPVDDKGQITADLACVRCGYNLRTLSCQIQCPECGVPIARSLHGDLLRNRDPAWLSQITSGAKWLVKGAYYVRWSTICFIILMLIFLVLSGLTTSCPIWVFSAGMYGLSGVGLFGLILFLVGCWRITAVDPGSLDVQRNAYARRSARWGLLGAVVAITLGATVDPLSHVAAIMLSLWAVALLIVGSAGLLTCLSGLAHRVPDPRLAERTRSSRARLAVMLLLGLILATSEWLVAVVPALRPATAGIPPTVGKLFALLKPLVGLTILGCLAEALRLVKEHYAVLQLSLKEAEQNWASAAGSEQRELGHP